jgi:hypothetical protein
MHAVGRLSRTDMTGPNPGCLAACVSTFVEWGRKRAQGSQAGSQGNPQRIQNHWVSLHSLNNVKQRAARNEIRAHLLTGAFHRTTGQGTANQGCTPCDFATRAWVRGQASHQHPRDSTETLSRDTRLALALPTRNKPSGPLVMDKQHNSNSNENNDEHK